MSRRVVFLLLLLVSLVGCGDLAHWHSRAVFGLDCRPEKLQNGQCVATR
jgi:hypothetical protein